MTETRAYPCGDVADLNKESDPLQWNLPLENVKAAYAWNCEWDNTDDAHLLVGVWNYGHGSWEVIRDDPTLGLADKFFLEDAKTKPADGAKPRLPNAIHLVRRADYLLHALRELDAHKKGGEQAASGSSKTHQPRAGSSRPKPTTDRASEGASAPPTSKSKHSKAALAKPPPKRKATPQYSSSEASGSEYDSMDEEACKEALRPVKRQLKKLKSGTENFTREEKVAHLKETLSAIGARIEVIAGSEKSPAAQEQRRKHLCKLDFLSSHLFQALDAYCTPLTCREVDDVFLAGRQGLFGAAAQDVRQARDHQGIAGPVAATRGACGARLRAISLEWWQRLAQVGRQACKEAPNRKRRRPALLQSPPFATPAERVACIASTTSFEAASPACARVRLQPVAARPSRRRMTILSYASSARPVAPRTPFHLPSFPPACSVFRTGALSNILTSQFQVYRVKVVSARPPL